MKYGEGVIFDHPRLADMENGDCHFTKFSSCINWGTDAVLEFTNLCPNGDPRCFVDIADMGADEYTARRLRLDVNKKPRRGKLREKGKKGRNVEFYAPWGEQPRHDLILD